MVGCEHCWVCDDDDIITALIVVGQSDRRQNESKDKAVDYFLATNVNVGLLLCACLRAWFVAHTWFYMNCFSSCIYNVWYWYMVLLVVDKNVFESKRQQWAFWDDETDDRSILFAEIEWLSVKKTCAYRIGCWWKRDALCWSQWIGELVTESIMHVVVYMFYVCILGWLFAVKDDNFWFNYNPTEL